MNYPVIVPIQIAWGEMDAFQHVNNVVFFRYFETARIAYFNQVEIEVGKLPKGVGPILAHTSCDYIRPITFPDTLLSKAKVTKIGNSSFTMAYELESERIGVCAKGVGVVVMLNYASGTKVPIPENVLHAIKAIENM